MSFIELKHILEKLEGVEVPPEYTANDKENDNVKRSFNQSLIEEYKEARDLYLRRRLERSILDHLKTYNGKSFVVPNMPSEEEQEVLKHARDQKLSEVHEKVRLINEKKLELQSKYSVFQSRREQYQEMLQDFEASQNNDDNDNVNDDDAIVDIDEEVIEAQKQNLLTLQKRRAELEFQIRSVKQENMEAQRALHNNIEDIAAIHTEKSSDYDISQESIQKLGTLNAETQAKLEKIKESKLFYDNLRELLEELGGIRLLNVESKNSSETTNEDVHITIEVMKKHEIKIGLKKNEHVKDQGVKISSIKLLSDPVIKAHIAHDTQEASLQLKIPDLSDLVVIAESRHSQEDNLAFIVRESMARISMIEKRVELLSELQKLVLTQVGKLYDSGPNNLFGGEDQEVICSFDDENVTVLLRLTPDCPFVNGSVFIDQLVGLGGWDQDLLETIKTRINDMDFKNPVVLIKALQEDIRKEQSKGFSLPRTPCLPQRSQPDSP